MNWPKIKTVLICLFLVIDLFLAGWDISQRHGKNTVTEDVIENTITLLEDRTIKVSPELIRRSVPNMETVTAKNAMADEAEFIGEILGSGYAKEDNRFYISGKEVIVDANSFKIIEDKTVNSLEEAKKWLEDNGFDLSGTVETEYMGSYVFKTVYNGFELFESNITVKREENKTIAEGSFLYASESGAKNEKILHVTSVLPRLISDGVQNSEITNITPGYMCMSVGDARFTEATASPVYRIILSDGREFFYDAAK